MACGCEAGEKDEKTGGRMMAKEGERGVVDRWNGEVEMQAASFDRNGLVSKP